MPRLPRHLRYTLRLLLAAGLLLCQPAHPQVTTEGQLKAAYLVNFVKYVEWPGSRDSVTLCLFGRDSLGPYLAPYEGREVAGLRIRLRSVGTPEQLADCQVVFVPETEESRFGSVLRWVGRQPILTVSDSEIFIRDGGAIALIRADGRMQFDVNLGVLNRAGLKAQSQMLRLARQVLGGQR